jgi:Tol biopolymer transport system component
MLQPVGAGEPTFLGNDGIAHNPWAGFFPDGERIVFSGSEPPRGSRIYVQRLPAGKPFPISPEGFGLSTANAVYPDGLTIAAIGPDERIYLCPAQGGEPRLGPGSKPGELVAGWDPNGPALLVFTPSELPVTLYRLGLGGERRVWRTLGSQDLAGAVAVHRVVVARGGRSYAYTLERVLSDLYLGTGLL